MNRRLKNYRISIFEFPIPGFIKLEDDVFVKDEFSSIKMSSFS